jgi:SPP1 gp7 family putative phage head morphogenesis protein
VADDTLLGQRLIAAARLATWETRIANAAHDLLAARQERVLSDLRAAQRPPVVASIPPDSFGTETWSTDVTGAVEPVAAEIFAVVVEDVEKLFAEFDPALKLPPVDLTHRLDRMIGHMVGLGQDTSDALGRTLTEGVNRGEGIDKLTERVKAVFSASDARAEAIARTETNGSVQMALNDTGMAVTEAGILLTRVWVATIDSRVRPSHLAANGQKRPMDKPFLVGGCELRYPCDGNSPCSAEVVACRCGTIFREAEV